VIRQGERGDQLFLVVSGRLEVTQAREGGHVRLGEVHRGEHFGEGALLSPTLRMADVRALTDCRLLSLSRESLDRFLARHPAQRDLMLAALEQRVAWAKKRSYRPDRDTILQLLANATDCADFHALSALAEEVEWVTVPRGDQLIRQGDPGDCLYVVVTGRLRVYGISEGHEVPIAEIGPGETVGEMSLLSSEPRSANVAAQRDAELLRLSKAGFAWLVEEHPRVMTGFSRTLVDRLSRGIRARSAVTQLRQLPVATPEECDEITKTPNLVLRNLRITQMYHRLSLEMTLLIGHQDANWCTFACNASKTAGYSIRGEELPLIDVLQLARRSQRVARMTDGAHQMLKRAGLLETVDDILESVSGCISAGNLKVFAEIAPVFARMIQTFAHDAEYDRAKLEAFTSKLRRGPTASGGQDLLAEAMTHYYDAMFELGAKRKAELILLANAKVGLHEQQRLQPDIVDALNAPLQKGLGGKLSGALTRPFRRVLPRVVANGVQGLLDGRERALTERGTAVWRRLVTRSMMTLRLPYGKVYLGRDMPRLPNEELFPDVLQRLELPELVALVKEYDYTADDLSGSGAADWGHLPDRMNFILDLFRSRQKSLELFDQPFLYQQRLDMAADRVPKGRL
jgi:CRP-like cAMP-binding protein